MRSVVLYELNEVPWQVIDMYVEARPESQLAKLLPKAECRTTYNGDPDHLSPWGTWPTFHTGLYRAEHNSHQLGQDPDTFRGTPMWEVAEDAGMKVGLFGALQSWPPREFKNGGFYVPDTFARTPETVPASLESFQEFNLSMTTEMGFSADRPLSMPMLAKAGLRLLAQGLTPRSAATLAAQLVRERRDSRYKAARSIMQALPAFDLYWRQHKKMKPELSIFFTNHVAGMMHRFWGDAFPVYSSANPDYAADPVFAGFVLEAMDIFDRQLGTILGDLGPDDVLVIAASMGQGPVPYHHIGETYVIDDQLKMAAALQLGPCETGMAMYPMYALEFPTEEAAAHAHGILGLIEVGGEPLIDEVNLYGTTVAYRVRATEDGIGLERSLTYRTSPDGDRISGHLEDLGMSVEERLGGGNTAYHVPEGIFITYGAGVKPDASRENFDVRDAAGVVLGHLGLAEAWEEKRTKVGAA